jgi:hypothetical protein
LTYWWRGSPDALFEVKLGTRVSLDDLGRQVDTLVGSGSPNTFTYCLPPWTHGSVLDLTFSLRDEDVGDVELVVDEVRIVDVEDCGTSTDLVDPRFESSRSSPTRRMGTRLSSALESVALEEAPGPSNGAENRVLALKSESTNTGLSVDTHVFVPGSDGRGPPAVTFYSRAPVSIASRVAWTLGLDESMSDSVNADEQWDLNVVCLPELWAGRWYRLRVEMTGATTPQAIDTLLLDDLEVGTSPDCL